MDVEASKIYRFVDCRAALSGATHINQTMTEQGSSFLKYICMDVDVTLFIRVSLNYSSMQTQDVQLALMFRLRGQHTPGCPDKALS